MLKRSQREPVTGSYKVDRDSRGRLPKGHSEMHFKLVVVDCGKEMLDGMRRSTPDHGWR